ncbi:uncharacterized protein AMSG_08568 [Thecamonas trahens ATCC 50062]|uniref:Cilia- and flagella-associated protein 157 n=1 Tax=Thecamonas trahens ATCC 50062 TaxID=461836 RepID=A0A0L0DK82_THETB|nr:hypothetical protein AMSG_08568 [Thecamonas trahens ATCC 50062]KNC52692.1 hypothetical protein AMSG_08568 [Thecamonas trahens ATCC 50062]|eukprot:XP_013755236.1 hypothetical protein AMSG_08568 [Thecamonas trahens ATCC 50062]
MSKPMDTAPKTEDNGDHAGGSRLGGAGATTVAAKAAGRGTGRKVGVGDADKFMVSPAEKAMWAMKIKDLETRLESAAVEVGSLKDENEELKRINEEIEKTAAANRAAWKILHEEKDSHIQFQTARAEQLKEEKAQRVAELELKVEELEHQAAMDMRQAEEKIRKLMRKIEATMKFVEVQHHLENELATLQQQRATEKVAFQKKYEEQDYQHLKAQKDLEARYDAKVKHLTAQMKGLSDSLMAETTKRTIVENIRLNKMIEDMSVNNKDLILEKEQMMVELLNLRRQKELLTVSEKVLAEKMTNARKVIKRLADKIRKLENGMRREADVDVQVESEIVALQEHVILLQSQLATAQSELHATEENLAAERRHREALQREQDSFLSMLEEAAGFILACLQDVKQQLALERETKELAASAELRRSESSLANLRSGGGKDSTNDAPSGAGADSDTVSLPPSLTALTSAERENVLEYLLKQLNALQVVGGMPQSASASKTGSSGQARGASAEAARGSRGSAGSSGPASRGRASAASRGSSRGGSDGRLSASIFRWATPSPSPGYYTGEHRPTVTVATQTVASEPTQLFDTHLGTGSKGASSSDEARAYRRAVLGDVRPWGAPAQQLPLTKRGPRMFLRKAGTGPAARRAPSGASSRSSSRTGAGTLILPPVVGSRTGAS